MKRFIIAKPQSLTPSEAFKLAARLVRWAWTVTETKFAKEKNKC